MGAVKETAIWCDAFALSNILDGSIIIFYTFAIVVPLVGYYLYSIVFLQVWLERPQKPLVSLISALSLLRHPHEY